jgi:excisionase family DNA binding protein
MENGNPQLLSLPALAEALKLPESWIKAEADAGRIPHLRIGKRYRFNRETVVAVLAHRAAQSGKAVDNGR